MSRIGRFLALVGAAAMLAQEPPLFRATTRLVEFTVVAVDKKGSPVTDLTKDDFTVEDKGKAREISFFRFEGAAPAFEVKPPHEPLPAGSVSNRVEYAPGPPRNLSAIVIDTSNTAPKDFLWLRAQVARYLRTLAPDTRLAIYHLGSRLRTVHDFTDDAESLRARIEKVLALPPQTMTDMEAAVRDAEEMLKMFDGDPVLMQLLTEQLESDMLANDMVRQNSVDRTLAALESLGRHLGGIPGRKNLIWISGGIPIISITGAMGNGAKGGIKSFEEPIRKAAQLLAQQGIALYAVDARGLPSSADYSASVSGSPMIRGRGHFERQQQAEQISNDSLPAMYLMSGITGGRVLTNTNNPAEGLRAAAADVRAAYSLAFYSTDEPDGKWHALKTSVRRSGVKLLYRQGYMAEPVAEKAQNWSEPEWQKAILNPLGSSSIHIEARCAPADGEPGVYEVSVQVEPADLYYRKAGDRDAADLDMVIAGRTIEGSAGYHIDKGSVTFPSNQTDRRPENCRYERRWKPATGVILARILVRDRNTGRYGSVDVPLKPDRPSTAK